MRVTYGNTPTRLGRQDDRPQYMYINQIARRWVKYFEYFPGVQIRICDLRTDHMSGGYVHIVFSQNSREYFTLNLYVPMFFDTSETIYNTRSYLLSLSIC